MVKSRKYWCHVSVLILDINTSRYRILSSRFDIKILLHFFFNMKDISPFWMILTFGDIWLWWILSFACFIACTDSSDSLLVSHLLTYWLPAYTLQALMGLIDFLFTIDTGHSADFWCQALLQLKISVTLSRLHCIKYFHTEIMHSRNIAKLLKINILLTSRKIGYKNCHYERNKITCFWWRWE